MAPVKGLKGEKLLVQIGDGASPETFVIDCLINTDRGIKFSSDTTDTNLPDCDNPGAPAWKFRNKDGFSAEISGSGKVHTPSVKLFWDWFNSDEGKNVRVLVDVAVGVGGGYWIGAFKLTDFDVTGTPKEYADCSVTLQSDGVITWVDAV
ncbi:phage tail tube protein [Rhizobium oryziradicis]|uniref:Phage tail protein n=1 Tax=Rhizobium oryziradicis TaxID=1867956 RepID=A0A1Q8ZRG9_9HYPH|nr:phage tail tube protein [Rhizobium oryziradicis]OLP44647.1 hypothetical protein BJF95_09110 [Rhizobium oryziradicis]